MDKYFNGKGTVGFTCDNCGKEIHNFVGDSGVRYCDRCYQEICGTNRDCNCDKQSEEYDKVFRQLQAKCSRCGNAIHSVDGAKILLDKDDKNVVVCNGCSEKYKEDYKPLPVIDNGAWLCALLVLAFSNWGDKK